MLLGYKDSDANSYNDIGYTIRSRLQFGINEGFPRIVSSDMCAGVGDVTYSIAVATCAKFGITDEQLAELLRGNP